MEIARQPVSAVIGVRKARNCTDSDTLLRALTAWQFERLDREDALRYHVNNCGMCGISFRLNLVAGWCRTGRRRLKALGEAQSRVITFNDLYESADQRKQTLF